MISPESSKESLPITAAAAAVETLVGHGIDTLFALPGAQIDHLFAALHDRTDRIRTITSRHEQGAAYMAFGYARSTGRPAVYSVVPGPGWLNASAALLTAYGCFAPVLSLAGQIPLRSIGRDYGELHEVPDQLGLARGLTKWAERVENPQEVSRQLASAVAAMQGGLTRPVHLEIPPDVMGAPFGGRIEGAQSVIECQTPEQGDVERAAALLSSAKRPVMFVGGGAQHCSSEVTQLAERLQIPVVAFRAGRGVIDQRHYLSQHWPSAHRLWAEADVVLAVGTRLDFPLRMWGFDPEMEIIWIDQDSERPRKIIEPAVELICDARTGLKGLLSAISPDVRQVSRKAEMEQRNADSIAEFDRDMAPQMSYLRAIRSALPEDGILVDELTQVGYASWAWFPTYCPRSYITSGYQGNLGYGFPSALGVKVANPDRPVISLNGDGGFQFGSAELATAAKYGIALTILVFNDGWYGNVRRIQQERYGNRVFRSDLTNPDYQLLARSYGIASERVGSAEQLGSAIRRAIGTQGPYLIEVPVGELPTPWTTIVRPRVRGT